MKTVVLGFYLVMVTISPNGDVTGAVSYTHLTLPTTSSV